MKIFMNIVKLWLPLAFLSTCLCGLAYVAVQQSYRLSANDPQIQIAEDAAALIQQGVPVTSLIPPNRVDVGTSLSTYINFYDNAGTVIGGNGMLNGYLATLPAGIFDYTRGFGEDRVTWQPKSGVRSAIVIVRINTATPQFVMVGRSLREVEVREQNLEVMTDVIWIISLLGTFGLQALSLYWHPYK